MESPIHTLLHRDTWQIIALICVIYVSFMILFAIPYYLAGDACQMMFDNGFTDAFYFSVITMTTIGYGAPEHYFGGCIANTIIIPLQYLTSESPVAEAGVPRR